MIDTMQTLALSSNGQALGASADAARYRRRQPPRLRRENGVWICVRQFTAVGAGVTPYAAYRDWCEKLVRSEHE